MLSQLKNVNQEESEKACSLKNYKGNKRTAASANTYDYKLAKKIKC